MSKVVDNSASSRPETDYTTKGNTFVTDLAPSATKLSIKKKERLRPIPVSLDSLNDPDATKKLLNTLQEKLNKINFDSPRTITVMEKLGILDEECELRNYEDFAAKNQDERIQRLHYMHHLSSLTKTFEKILEERKRLVRNKEKTKKKLGNILAVNSTISSKNILDSTTGRMNKTFDPDMALRKIRENHERMLKAEATRMSRMMDNELSLQERRFETRVRFDKADLNKSLRSQEKLKKIDEQKRKFDEHMEKNYQISKEKEREWAMKRKELFKLDKEKAQLLEQLKRERDIKLQHMREKELQQFNSVNKKLEEKALMNEREIDNLILSLEQKDLQAMKILSEERNRQLDFIRNQQVKYETRRYNAMLFLEQKEHDAIQKVAESHIKHQEELKLIKEDLELKTKEKMREEKRAFRKVRKNLERIKSEHLLRAKSWEKRLASEDDQIERFHAYQQEERAQKALSNHLRLQSNKLNFDRIMTDFDRKCNVQLSNDAEWQEKWKEKKQMYRLAREASMKNSLFHSKQREKLYGTLDQVAKMAFSQSHTFNTNSFMTVNKNDATAMTPTSTTQDESRFLELNRSKEHVKETIFDVLMNNRESVNSLDIFKSMSNWHSNLMDGSKSAFSTPKNAKISKFRSQKFIKPIHS